MNDLHLLDHLGPQPTAPSAAVVDAARARLDAAMRKPAPPERRSRRLPLLAAAAVAAVGLAVTPALVGSDTSVALASVDPMTFPLTPMGLPGGLGEPVFERDHGVITARYGPVLDGVSITTDVEDGDFWSIPDDAPTAQVRGREATVVSRTVHDGSDDSAPAVSVIWQTQDDDWTAVTGSGTYADAGWVTAIAKSLQEQPQPVDLALRVAPRGWTVAAYKQDRVLVLAGPDGAGADDLTVALVDRTSPDLAEYGARDVEDVVVNGQPAQLGHQELEADGGSWVVEALTTGGQPFSLQAPAALTREQVLAMAESVTYAP